MTDHNDNESQQSTRDDAGQQTADDDGVDIPVHGPDDSDSEASTEAEQNDGAGDGHASDDAEEPDFDARETAQETPAVGTAPPETDSAGEDDAAEQPAEGELDDLYLDPEDDEAEVVEETPEDLDEVDGDDLPDEAANASNGQADGEAAEVERGELVERIDELEHKVEQLQDERDEMEDRMYRAAADLENFRKRAKREKEELEKYGAKDVILEMLPAIDNLERALEHGKENQDAPDDGQSDGDRDKNIVDGVDMTLRQLHTALEKHGIEVFDAEGDKFDPELHEAMQQVETDEHPPGTVVEQFQRGYTIKDRLLRPALVAVAKQPADAHSDDESDQTEASADEPSTSDGDAEAMQPADDAADDSSDGQDPPADQTDAGSDTDADEHDTSTS